MNYPYGPYQSGSGGQPDFTQQPAGFPQPGFPHHGGFAQPGQPPILNAQPGQPQPGPTEPTAGKTGIAAAALAGVAAVAMFVLLLVSVIAMLVDFTNGRQDLGETLGAIVGNVLVYGGYGMLWLFGSIKLYKPRRAGRGMVIAGSVLAVLIAVIGIVATYTDATRDGHPAFFVMWIVALIYMLTTLVLAVLPATGAWIRANAAPSTPQESASPPVSPFQGYPTQNPGYPPHYG
ncbi:hypothetical protein [Mycolicibacterium fortuitum]|uniref:hypothetical protein n=1 Tax=Mycolicibacterium fortuitum TaxID=1766 RepID=UPI00096FCAD9|nr:hypothetical protein [Mycolicibacterium fortuitum]OMC06957.1 hypothetical protein A5734_03990 [Mycolicibacterium fortuitum]